MFFVCTAPRAVQKRGKNSIQTCPLHSRCAMFTRFFVPGLSLFPETSGTLPSRTNELTRKKNGKKSFTIIKNYAVSAQNWKKMEHHLRNFKFIYPAPNENGKCMEMTRYVWLTVDLHAHDALKIVTGIKLY